MGFRSTLTTEHFGTELPAWFKEKYDKDYFITGTLVSSKCELKHYGDEFLLDYQKALNDVNFLDGGIKSVCVVVMGEDDFITKVRISKEDIKYIWLREDDGMQADGIWNQG